MASGEITRLLGAWHGGEPQALDEVVVLLYTDLRRLAQNLLGQSQLGRRRSTPTLQATALVHEAYLRLTRQQGVDWRSRGHFFAIAATLMRRLVIDACRRRAMKRRHGMIDDESEDATEPADYRCADDELLAIADALERLRAHAPELARIVELRFFLGLGHAEAAEVLDVSERTAKRRWHAARLWLFHVLHSDRHGLGGTS